ncbi:MAG: tetratricopeptide repeat protein [Acidobacteria bacterium]|nr:tetratricopeptide repeat protein [Acidobacteriota bacterium]
MRISPWPTTIWPTFLSGAREWPKRCSTGNRRGLQPAVHDGILFQLGKCYTAHGRLQEALTRLTKAIELDPKEKMVFYQLAQLYARLKEPDKQQLHLETFQKQIVPYPEGRRTIDCRWIGERGWVQRSITAWRRRP